MRFSYDNIRPARHTEGTPSPVPIYTGPPPRPRREERPRIAMTGFDDLSPDNRRQRVLQALRQGPMTPARLIEAVHCKTAARVHSELRWLKRNGEIHQTEDGVYHHGPAPDPITQDQQAEDTAAQLGAVGEPKGEDPGHGETTDAPDKNLPGEITWVPEVVVPTVIEPEDVDRIARDAHGHTLIWIRGQQTPLELDVLVTYALQRLFEATSDLTEIPNGR